MKKIVIKTYFDFFLKRNKELNMKPKVNSNSKPKQEDIIEDDALSKLQELINKDSKESNYKTLNNENDEFIPIEEEKNVLVNRPLKNFVWGLGHQTKQRKSKINFLSD
jgi:hypothetical protein